MDLSKSQKFDRKDCLNWKFIVMIIVSLIYIKFSSLLTIDYLISRVIDSRWRNS